MEIGRAFCLLALWLPAQAFAGNQERLFLDDEAALTSAAVVAAGSEPGSAWYNPAGIASIQNPAFKLGASAYAGRFYAVPQFMQVKLPDRDASLGIYTRSFFSTPSSLVYASDLSQRISGAFAVFTRDQLDLTQVESRVFEGSIPSADAYVNEQSVELGLFSKSYAAGPALGLRLAPGIRLGAALFGQYNRFDQVTRFGNDFYRPSTYNSFGFYDYRLTSSMDTRYAIGQYMLRGHAGAQVDLPGRLSFGAAFHSPDFFLYQDVNVELVLDGNATTQVAGYPGGIVIRVHAKEGQVSHPYAWGNPYRGFMGLARHLEGGYISVEADFSDLPAEQGRGMLWNYRVGFKKDLNEVWGIGAGAYTDHMRRETLLQVAQSNVDYYGGTMGLRYRAHFRAKERDPSKAELGPEKAMVMTTTLSLHYQRGYGEIAGVKMDATKIEFPPPLQMTTFMVEDMSIHLGGGFVF